MSDKALELTPIQKQISDSLQSAVSIDKAGAVTTKDDANIFVANMPEGITEESYKKHSGYNTDFVAGVSHGFGALGIAAQTKHKDIEQVAATFPMVGRDRLEVTVHRSKTYPNQADPANPITKHGVVVAKLDLYADRNAGQLKAIRQNLNELGAAAVK